MVGLYLDPPDKALVLCVDEKSQIQALDRTQPALPMRPGLVARRTHDHVRHGTTLFAALNFLEGTVIGSCLPRHRHEEFLTFMERVDRATPHRREIHLVLDNYGTHKHPEVKEWFTAHPRYYLHFVPTGSSWLNLVERWSGEIIRKRIRRGAFRNVPELVRAIYQYLRENNKNPRPFIWTATAAELLHKVEHCNETMDSPHQRGSSTEHPNDDAVECASLDDRRREREDHQGARQGNRLGSEAKVGPLAPHGLTVTVPVISGWISQW